MPVQKIRLRIDLSSIEERGKVYLLLREDFQEVPTNPEDHLGRAFPLLSPFRRDYDRAPVVNLLQDCAHGIYPTICHAYRIMVKVVNKDDFLSEVGPLPFRAPRPSVRSFDSFHTRQSLNMPPPLRAPRMAEKKSRAAARKI